MCSCNDNKKTKEWEKEYEEYAKTQSELNAKKREALKIGKEPCYDKHSMDCLCPKCMQYNFYCECRKKI
jgi:hypothetical protein